MIQYVIAYLTGIVFILLFIWFCQYVGGKFHKKGNFLSNLLYGYVIYTSIQALGGIIVQMLKLQWIYYEIYMFLLIIVLVIYKFNLSYFQSSINKITAHFKKNYLLYLVAFVLVSFSLLNYSGLWNGNRQDDGWYITQITQLPKVAEMYNISAPTGFYYEPSIMRAFNTYEMEAAFYADVLQIPASIFVKFVLAYLHYFLLCACVCLFGSKVFDKDEDNVVSKSLCCCVLFFAFTYSFIQRDQLLVLTDDWQFNSAMGYGSSVVRTLGLFLLALPLLERNLFSKKNIVYYFLVSIALISKGTQALPIIYLVSAALLIYWVCTNLTGKKRMSIIFFGVCLMLLFPPLGESFSENYKSAYVVFAENFKFSYTYVMLLLIGFAYFLISKKHKMNANIFIIFVLLALAIGNIILVAFLFYMYSFTFQNAWIKKWNYILLLIAALMFIPRLNTLFIDFSVYDFVVKRSITLYMITFILTAFTYLAYFLTQSGLEFKKVSHIMKTLGCCFAVLFMINLQRGESVIHILTVLKNNPELLPSETVQLSKRLDEISLEKGQNLNVIMPVTFTLNNKPHYPYVLLRIHSLNVRSVSAIARYGQEESENHDELVRGYSYSHQAIIDKLNLNDVNVSKYKSDLENILESFPVIDTFIVSNPNFKDMLIEDFGFELIDKIAIVDSNSQYYILCEK